MKKIITSVYLCIAAAGFAQNPSWVHYPAPADYQNYDVQEVSSGVDSVGNIYTAASVSDTINNLDRVMLVKHNTAGVQQWISFYDSGVANHKSSYAVKVLVDKAGNCYIAGYGYHNTTNLKDFMLLKYDNTGTQQWVQYWDGGQNIHDYASCAAFDAAGNIIVAGYANFQGTTWDDMAAVKWSTSGTLLWSYQYNNSAANDEDRVNSVASDANNNIFLAGSSYNTKRDMITIKLNSAGTQQWVNRHAHMTSGSDERAYSVAADAAGNSYVTGDLDEWTTIKYSPSGAVLWSYAYTLNALNRYNPKKVMLDKFNNVYIAGDAFVGSGNFSDLVIMQIDNTGGNFAWTMSINNSGSDMFGDAVIDTMGFIYMAGSFDGPLGTDMSAALFSTGGTMLWNSTFTNTNNTVGTDLPYSIAADKNRNIIISGVAETRRSGSDETVDVVVLKYDALVLGINEQSAAPLYMQIFPNPSAGQLNININDAKLLGSQLTISNVAGQVVREEKINNLSQTMNLDDLAKGMYMVTLKSEHGVANKKLIIK